MKIKIKIHSFVDLITNSSTEIFATVQGEQEAIEKVIKEVLDDLGCDDCVEFQVRENEDWDTSEVIKGQYVITYDFECHSSPCKVMDKKLKEKLSEYFTIIED